METKNIKEIYNNLPSEIRDYSERVAYNTQVIFLELIDQEKYTSYSDLKIENVKYIYEAVKYFDIGFAFKKDDKIYDKVLPIYHVNEGANVFFSDIKKREEFVKLASEEKFIRRIGKEVALYHHETWDGKGYPSGLKMEEIPVVARICHLCLEFEKLTSNLTNKEAAINLISELSGSDFDPTIVDVFVDCVDKLIVKGENFAPITIVKNVEKNKEVQKIENEANQEIEVIDSKKKKEKIRPIEVFFIPVKDVKTDKIVYYQTKVIINDRYYGSMEPVIYEMVAEKFGKITDLVMICLEQVKKFIDIAESNEIDHSGILVKIHDSILVKESNFNKILNYVEKNNINPEVLIFEISEKVLANAEEEIKDRIKKIKKLGIRISIRDFGMEYSSLSKLGEIDFDIITISHRFTKQVQKNTKMAGVIRSIIDMAKTFDAEEICEGVDYKERREILKKIGCRKMQGSIIGEGITLNDLRK